jgi:hypothetical protein
MKYLVLTLFLVGTAQAGQCEKGTYSHGVLKSVEVMKCGQCYQQKRKERGVKCVKYKKPNPKNRKRVPVESLS